MLASSGTPPAAPPLGGPPATDRDRPDLAGLAEPELSAEFGRLFEEHADALRRYLARRVGSAIADDIVAEAFLTALRGRENYDPARATVKSWLHGIAANLLRHHARTEVRGLRAFARLARQPGIGADHADRVGDRVDAADRVNRLSAAVAQLPPGDREVLLMTSWAGLTAAEIGDALGIPAGTVRSRLHRVRQWLRTHASAVRIDTSEDETDD